MLPVRPAWAPRRALRAGRAGLVIAGAIAAIAASPARADAAACCGAGHGVGPLLTDAERAAVTFGIGGTFELGSWTHRGAFHPMGEGDYRRELRVELGWIVRFLRDGQLGVTVPFVAPFARLGGESASGAAPGDVTVFGRYDVVRPRVMRWYPGVALTLSTTLPTGRPERSADFAAGRVATGLGAGEVRPGFALEKRWIQGFYAFVSGSVGVRTRFHLASGPEVALAPRYQVFAACGPFWEWGLSMSLGVLFEREPGPSIDGRVAPATARGRTAGVFFAAYDLDAHWTAVAQARVDLPIRGAGANEPVAIAPILGIRRVFGARE